MKLLIRFMSLIVVGIITSICLIYLINVNIMKNEMDNASKISIEACQNIIKSKTIDSYLGLEKSDYEIVDDETYRNYFISSFNGLVADKSIYDIDVHTDYEKGLIAVIVHNKYSSFLKDVKLINIIEVSE